MIRRLRLAPQEHEITVHDLKVMSLSPSRIKLRVHSSSV